jgi:hypothetical protein
MTKEITIANFEKKIKAGFSELEHFGELIEYFRIKTKSDRINCLSTIKIEVVLKSRDREKRNFLLSFSQQDLKDMPGGWYEMSLGLAISSILFKMKRKPASQKSPNIETRNRECEKTEKQEKGTQFLLNA